MMKSYIILIVIGMTFSVSTHAQQTQTLISEDIRHGGYGAPVFGVTSVNGEPSYLRGIRGAWIINFSDEHALNIGLANYRTRTDFAPVQWEVPGTGEPEMRTNYGGFEIEYMNRSRRLIHYSLQVLAGSGTVRYDDDEINLIKTSDSYFALQPGVSLNLNVTSWFRISGSLLYRYTGGVHLEGTSNSDLSGLAAFASLRFGKF